MINDTCSDTMTIENNLRPVIFPPVIPSHCSDIITMSGKYRQNNVNVKQKLFSFKGILAVCGAISSRSNVKLTLHKTM